MGCGKGWNVMNKVLKYKQLGKGVRYTFIAVLLVLVGFGLDAALYVGRLLHNYYFWGGVSYPIYDTTEFCIVVYKQVIFIAVFILPVYYIRNNVRLAATFIFLSSLLLPFYGYWGVRFSLPVLLLSIWVLVKIRWFKQ